MSKEFSRYGILFVVSAPSGAGKSTLCDALRQTPDFVYSVSCTTRLPRAGEIDGEDYHFLSQADFLARIEAQAFLEYAEVHGKYYGTLREPILSNLHHGVDVLIDIDTQGAAAIREFDDAFVRQALADVFIMPPDLEELRRRLTKRGTETPDKSKCDCRPRRGRWNTGAIIATLSSAARWRKTCSNFATSWARNAT